MRTAVADEMVLRNPCQVERAGVERSPERPVATIAEVVALANAIAPRFRTLVLVSAWCGLRRGELFALRRGDFDPLRNILRVERAMQQLANGTLVIGPPKTEAGRRTVAIPPHIGPNSRRTWNCSSTPTRRAGLYRRKGRPTATARPPEGVEQGLHLHDLRHSGNTRAAATGASTKELMARMGHANSAAALRYQHATADRD
jgi:integrase